MEEACRFIGVDIGNSGLRIAELDVAKQAVGNSQRVSWCHAVDAVQVVSSGPRFAPGSTAWLDVIAEFLEDRVAPGQSAATRCVWLVSSVRRDALNVLEQFVDDRAGRIDLADRWRVIARRDVDLEVDVLEPDRVGIDRLLAASAAADLLPHRPLIVMQVGSALTVDLVREPKVFCGGAILPGVPMMLRLLGQSADLLPAIEADELTDLPELPGRNTEQAMRCGTASALVGGAQHLVHRYRQRYGDATPIVLSGGDGTRLAPHLLPPLHIVPHLVLKGLIPIAIRCQAEPLD
jgi:pantothenate kinase type III